MECSIFLEAVCGGDGLVMIDFYFLLTFETLYNLHLEMVGILKTVLIFFVRSQNSLAPGSPYGKRKRLSSARVPLFESCGGILACTRKKHPSPGQHVELSKKK